MNRLTILLFLAGSILFTGCIGDDIIDDFVESSFRIIAKVDSLAVGDTYQFEGMYTNNIGLTEDVPITWTSSNPDILSINEQGIASGLAEGEALITSSVIVGEETFMDETMVVVADRTVASSNGIRTGTVQTTTFYELEGTFEFREDTDRGQLVLSFADDYKASSSLPGLYIYLTNNPNSTNGAYEIGEVTTFSGAHEYKIRMGEVALNEHSHVLYFCKPFRVKVGDGAFTN